MQIYVRARFHITSTYYIIDHLLITEYPQMPKKSDSYATITLIFQLTDIIIIPTILLCTPVGILLKLDPIHHIFMDFFPHYADSFGLQIWIAITCRIPLCTILALDVARCWISIAMFFIVGCKVWLRYFFLVEQPYRNERCFSVSLHTKLSNSIATYREILVLQKIYHYPLMTMPTLLTLFVSLAVILANYFAIRMHHVIPSVILYFGIPPILVAALWVPYHVLPDCGDFNSVSVELLRKWKLRGGWVWGNVRRKEIQRRLRSLPPSNFKFGVGDFAFLNMTRGTKGMYHKVIIDYTISVLLFKWKV